MRRPTRSAACLAIAAVLVAAGSASALTISLTPDAGLSSNPAALAAFNRAAAQWTARLTDPVSVTINAGLAGGFANANTIGQASTVVFVDTYSNIRNQVVVDAANEPTNAIVAALPTAAQFSASLPPGYAYSGNLRMSSANAKALGFNVAVASDATITFNNAFSFDYDNSNGVSPGTVDFESVAAHEIGHALGFFSTVDNVNAGVTSVSPTTLDLFRFASKPSVATFTTAPREMRPGVAAVTSDAVDAWAMSTGITVAQGGTIGGDGNQASHWKEDGSPNGGPLNANYIGIMDPTLGTATIEPITYADLRALDLIGWDLNLAFVPEPASLAVLGGLAVVGVRRRRQA